MDSAEMKLFQENVEEFVMDENKIVTFKYLACTLQISVDIAKRILQEYVFPGGKRRTEVNITYVLGGHLSDNQGYKIALVRESDVAEVEKRFISVELKEIFCVHKVASVLDLNVIYGIDGNLHNVKPRITCKNAVQRAQRAQLAPPVSAPKPPIKTIPSAPIKPAAKEPEVSAVTTPKPAMASIFGNAPTKKSPAANSSAAKPKKGGGIASFFSKQDKAVPISKPLDPVKVQTPDKEPSKEIKSEPSKNVTTASSSKENSPKNESPPRTAKLSQKKKKTKRTAKEEVATKQRRRIMVMSDSESSAGEESDVEERCPSPEAPPPDFRGESSDEDVVPATPNAASGGRKKVLKVKTTFDDEGFVVTSKEWVWEGEEENAAKEKKDVVGNGHESRDRKKMGNHTEETVKLAKKSTIEELMQSDDEDKAKKEEMAEKHKKGKKVKSEGEEVSKKTKNGKRFKSEEEDEEKEEEIPKKSKKGKRVKSEEEDEEIEEEIPKKNKRGQKEKPVEKEKVDVKEGKAKAEKKESKAQAKKREGSNSDKSESKSVEKRAKAKPTEDGQDGKKAGSKRKLAEVISSEDESQGQQEKAATKQPAKKQPPKKKSPPKASGTQTNIMAFFGKK